MDINKHLEVVEEWFWSADADSQPFRTKLKNFLEEYREWETSLSNADNVEEFDALIDMYWVGLDIINTIINICNRNDYPLPQGFKEVARSNFSKFKRVADGNGSRYEILKREDGKILKHPDSYSPPNLKKILDEIPK